jgi:cytochrome P450
MIRPFPIDPLSLEFRSDPVRVLNEMRRQAPVWRHEEFAYPMVSVLSYSGVKAVYRDYKTFSSFIPEEARRFELADGISLIGEDPPVHTHIRTSISKLFTAHAIEVLRPTVEKFCDAIFDDVLEKGEIDCVEDLAAKLTVRMISTLVGVPDEDAPLIRDWTVRQAALNGVSAYLPKDDPRWSQMESATKLANDELQAYFALRVDERVASPRDDILTMLVQSGLARQETISFAKILIMAGNETTTNLINNTVRLLIDEPEQQAILRAEPDLVNNAIEESLRCRTPLNDSGRTATRDIEIEGETIREGDGISLWIASANRDKNRFENPDTFDIRRETKGILSFGHGLHACLGAPLARLEGRVFLETLLRRTRGMERTREEMPPVASPSFNGVKAQHIRLLPN